MYNSVKIKQDTSIIVPSSSGYQILREEKELLDSQRDKALKTMGYSIVDIKQAV